MQTVSKHKIKILTRAHKKKEANAKQATDVFKNTLDIHWNKKMNICFIKKNLFKIF